MPRFWFSLAAFALIAGLAGLVPAGAQPVPLVKKGGIAPPPPAETTMTDEEALKEAGLSSTDGAKLIGYLKQRTLSDTEQGRIKEIIARFGSDEFDDRLAAVAEVEQYGPAAIGPLKQAEQDKDPEVAYRVAQALKKLEKIPHTLVAAAAVRGVVRLKPPDAAAALLGFLPLADSEALADDIRGALIALAVQNGKPEPALVAALNDKSPVRRGAAYVALTEGGPATERIRIKDAYPLVKAAVRKETDIESKFRGLWSLTMTTREKEFIPDLIAMIPQLPRGRIWQLEEFLLQLSGTHPEGGRFGKTPEALAKARDAWAGWWEKKGGPVDLVKLDFKPRIHGFTDLVEMDPRGYGQGRISTLGPDLKEKWRMPNLTTAMDAHMLPNGRMLVVENVNPNRVSERDLNGKITLQRNPNNLQPLAAEMVPDGGMLVVCRGGIIEYDKEGKVKFQYPRQTYDILGGRRLPNGDTVFLANIFQGPNCFRLDAKGAEIGKPLTLGRVFNQGLMGMDLIGEETILVGEQDKVVEYDLKTGKAGWKHGIGSASSVQRLPNGNTLIASLNTNRVVEVDPDGTEVWEYTSRDNVRVARAYRR